MITKDQLELLNKPSQNNKELRYTIGGAVEATVHSSLESERIGQLNRGHRKMSEAVQHFRDDMAFKSREGLAQSQFQHASHAIPPSDQRIAEQTWRQNHQSAHEATFDKARSQFRTAMTGAVKGELPAVDTDLGYGAGQDHATVNRYVNHGVAGFKTQMKSQAHKIEHER